MHEALPPYRTYSSMSGNRKHVDCHYHLSRTREWMPSDGTSLPGDPASLASGSHSTTTPHSPSQPALGHPRHYLYPRDRNMRRKGRLEDWGKDVTSSLASMSYMAPIGWRESVWAFNLTGLCREEDKMPDLHRRSSVRMYLPARETLSKHSPTWNFNKTQPFFQLVKIRGALSPHKGMQLVNSLI